MPSPFPGMDPWLEHPHHWPGVHARLIAVIGDALDACLPKKYYADIEERLYVCQPDDPVTRMIVPDVIIREHQKILENSARAAEARQGSTATLQAPIIEPLEIRERRVVIRTVDKNRVVTVIELLSPANKTRGSKGRRHYIRKRNNVLDSSAHFVEIDLLRGGDRFEGYTKLPPSDYLIAVSREPIRPTADWWLVKLEDRLPEIPIPLRKGDADVMLDLQAVLNTFFDRSDYGRRLRYDQPPEPPLTPAQTAWASELVAAHERSSARE